MNIHPILVHFPVALLTIYSLLELIRWKRLTSQSYWFYLKAAFLLLGGLGALAAFMTGDIAKEALNAGLFISPTANYRDVVNMHEFFADITVTVYGILAACYLVAWLNKENFAAFADKVRLGKVWAIINAMASKIVDTPLVIFLALVGLAVLTITGGLGGVLVYGPAADPLFKIIYQVLFGG